VPELIDTLYPRRCPSTGQICRLCPDQVTLVVCLPAGSSRERQNLRETLAAAVDPHVAVPAGVIDGSHFPLWHNPDAVESTMLLLPNMDPDIPEVVWCAGGPVGLLDLDTTAAYVRRLADHDVDRWHTAVAGTPPAVAWWHFLHAHRADQHRYTLARAVADFQAQPRIAAMRDAAGQGYGADMYGPGLEAVSAGAGEYADYQAGLLSFGDGLIGLDGDLLVPAPATGLVEQTLLQRRLYHQRARRYIQSLDPGVVLAAVRCFR